MISDSVCLLRRSYHTPTTRTYLSYFKKNKNYLLNQHHVNTWSSCCGDEIKKTIFRKVQKQNKNKTTRIQWDVMLWRLLYTAIIISIQINLTPCQQLHPYKISWTLFLNLKCVVDFCTPSGKRSHSDIPRARGLLRYFSYVRLYGLNLILPLFRRCTLGRRWCKRVGFLLNLYINEHMCSSCLTSIEPIWYIPRRFATEALGCCLL